MELEERVTREQALVRQPSPWSTATLSDAIVLATMLIVLTGLRRRGTVVLAQFALRLPVAQCPIAVVHRRWRD